MGRQDAQKFASAVARDAKAIAWQRLAGSDSTEVEGEIGELGEAAGFLVEMRDLEQPALRLAARVLAGDPIKPALDAAGQPEIGRVDRKDQRPIDDATVEPVGKDKLHSLHPAAAGRAFLPFVDPGKLVTPPMLAIADGRADDG